MTDWEIRIAIAEKLGWKYLGYTIASPIWRSPDGRSVVGLEAPDYANDLNAMHDAEKSLTSDQTNNYRLALLDFHSKHFHESSQKVSGAISSTSKQRALAFIKTTKDVQTT